MQMPKFRRTSAAQSSSETQDRPALIDQLESRIYFAHFGHEVFLPAAAENGSNGLEAAIDAPADHRRGRLIISA